MLNKLTPHFIYRRLWGDRKRFGCIPLVSDPDWIIWQEKAFNDFYEHTQQQGIGDRVCRMAYPVISRINFEGKWILEIGPGIIRHLDYINTKPNIYIICDIEKRCLEESQNILDFKGIPNNAILINNIGDFILPFKDESVDIIIAFNTLEHLYPLKKYLLEMKRVLRGKGCIIGGIPCEGGIAWGLGRFLTTRRYVHKKYGINYDKIICWEHPNFADHIFDQLSKYFQKEYLKLHPFNCLPMDYNVVASFIFKKN